MTSLYYYHPRFREGFGGYGYSLASIVFLHAWSLSFRLLLWKIDGRSCYITGGYPCLLTSLPFSSHRPRNNRELNIRAQNHCLDCSLLCIDDSQWTSAPPDHQASGPVGYSALVCILTPPLQLDRQHTQHAPCQNNWLLIYLYSHFFWHSCLISTCWLGIINSSLLRLPERAFGVNP